MRALCLAAATAAALACVATPAAACCHRFAVAYGAPPLVPVAGYVFEPPADHVDQIYVVNQGPVLSGPGIYTYTNPYVPSFVPPPYPAVGYVHAARYRAYETQYPYVRRIPRWHCPGCGGVAPVYTRRYRAYRY
jgi:hypothetical protein